MLCDVRLLLLLEGMDSHCVETVLAFDSQLFVKSVSGRMASTSGSTGDTREGFEHTALLV